MEAFSITQTLSPTAASPQSPAASAGSPGDAPASGLSFGGIFNTLRPEAGRQDLAAALCASGLPVPQLVSHPLGEAMAVITADSPVPAQDSLLAFARSQGLDEAAIAALWQPTTPATSGATLAGAAAAPGLGGMPAQPLGDGAAASAANASPLNVQLMGLVVQSLPGTGQARPPAAAAATPPQEPDPLLLQSLRLTPQALGLRNPQRAQPQAPAEQLLVGNKTPGSPPQEPPTLTLDLEGELTELTRVSASDGEAPLPDPAPATSTATPLTPEPTRSSSASAAPASGTTPAHTVISGYQLKLEHYQQLAERMGQALAQRLQEQIDQGQWSLKLRLNPVELGQIDVQLDMHAGGLDARFQTDNPLTKDLILQGSARLKDSLSEHGTTVASVWVNSDDRRQSGGNSTPQQQQRRASPNPAPSRAEPLAQAPAPRNSRPDGWDMLA